MIICSALGGRALTNNVVAVLMDNEAFDYYRQVRGEPWDRELHAQLLNKLSGDGCALVVFDSLFQVPRDARKDKALAEAMRRQRRLVLMAEQAAVTHPIIDGFHPVKPCEPFLSAAATNWGVAWFDPDLDSIVRRHWPFPAPGPYPSLAWSAARLANAKLNQEPEEQWLRYYPPNAGWTRLSYRFALTQPTNYFRDKVVFIGTQPRTSTPDNETDEFRTPLTRWTGESMAGVEIIITAFLNLVNQEWLRRPNSWSEAVILVLVGSLLGGALCRLSLRSAVFLAAGSALSVSLGAVCWSYYSNYWFPWLVIAGGEVPCALVWALAAKRLSFWRTAGEPQKAGRPHVQGVMSGMDGSEEHVPDIPGYDLVHPAFGQGAYGKVWLARDAARKWQAVKVIYVANFGDDSGPYEREYNGVKRYEPISDKHPGLLRVEFVSQKNPEGYFYYVMELGDPLESGWERNPCKYRPLDLVRERHRTKAGKLSPERCIQIGLTLADALEFLHRQGLTHRDIKPQNVIFVNGRPKLADVGLIAEVRPDGEKRTYIGTPGYMPPLPELPGTPQADIYALGMMLYVISTGRNPSFFPEITTTLASSDTVGEFFPLNSVILKACQPEASQRYTSAAEMHCALQETQAALECGHKV